MSTPNPAGYMDPSSAERLGGGGLLSRFGHNYPRFHRQHIVEGPILVEEASDDPEVVGTMQGPALKVNADGEIDPKHRRIKEAQAAVASARETMPESADPGSIEELMDLAA